MKIAYYCQHVLGIGHFHRSLEICRCLAKKHQVTLILGGPDVNEKIENITVLQLPGLRMDKDFSNLQPTADGLTLSQVKETRRQMLHAFFKDNRPEIFVVELYPFGRKAFRFELDPVLSSLRDGTLSPCKCYVSLRDILVERSDDAEKFSRRAVTTLNQYFDGVLIHSDASVIRLDETFGRVDEINIPMAYTGFVSRPQGKNNRLQLRKRLGLSDADRLIVVSSGGGNVGMPLLLGATRAFAQLAQNSNYHMQLFSGPYLSCEQYRELQQTLPPRATLERFSNTFVDWLQAADLSISMAGYNTCMDILQAGVPALVYPFAQNQEQLFRAKRLQQLADITILSNNDLEADILANLMVTTAQHRRYPTAVRIDGGEESRKQIEAWHFRHGKNHD